MPRRRPRVDLDEPFSLPDDPEAVFHKLLGVEDGQIVEPAEEEQTGEP